MFLTLRGAWRALYLIEFLAQSRIRSTYEKKKKKKKKKKEKKEEKNSSRTFSPFAERNDRAWRGNTAFRFLGQVYYTHRSYRMGTSKKTRRNWDVEIGRACFRLNDRRCTLAKRSTVVQVSSEGLRDGCFFFSSLSSLTVARATNYYFVRIVKC